MNVDEKVIEATLNYLASKPEVQLFIELQKAYAQAKNEPKEKTLKR